MKRRSDGIITLLEEVKREREGGGGEDAFYNTHYHYITLHLEIAHTIITLLHLFIAGRVRVVNAFFWWLGLLPSTRCREENDNTVPCTLTIEDLHIEILFDSVKTYLRSSTRHRNRHSSTSTVSTFIPSCILFLYSIFWLHKNAQLRRSAVTVQQEFYQHKVYNLK